MLETVVSIVGAVLVCFGLFALVELLVAGRLEVEDRVVLRRAVLFALALLAVGYHLEVRPGVIIDARGAVVAIATLFGGTVWGSTVACAAALWRIVVGGAGTWAGVAGLAADFVLSVVAVRLLAGKGVTWRTSLWPVVAAGFAVALGEAASLLLVPPRASAVALLRESGPPLALAQLVATVLLGGLGRLLWERNREGKERETLAKRYALLSRYSGDAVLLADAGGWILEASARACRLYGYEEAELRARRLDDLRTASSPSAERASFTGPTSSLRGGFRQLHLRKDGTRVEVEVKERLVDDAGVPFQLLVVRDITATEKTLLRYHKALETTTDGFVIFSRDRRVLEANHALEVLTGYTRDELRGKDLAGLLAMPGGGEVLVAEILAGGEGRGTFEARLKRHDGSERDVEVSASAGTGENEPLIAFVRDIGERKRAEGALKASEARHRRIVETTLTGLLEVDGGGVVTFANRTVAEMLGTVPEKLVGRSILEFVDDKSRPVVRLRLGHRGPEARSPFEVRFAHGLGGGGWALVHGAPVFDDGGAFHGFLVSLIDITDRRRQEEELRVKEAAIAASSAAIVITDLGGTITFANDAFLGLWGCTSEEELLGTSVFDCWRERRRAEEVTAAILNEGRWVGEMVARRRDGTTFEANVLANRVADESGRPICLLASFVDVTGPKTVARALRREKERLETASRAGKVAMWDWDFVTGEVEWSGYEDPGLAVKPGSKPVSREELNRRIHPDDLGPMLRALQDHLEKGQPYDQEFRVLREDGAYVWCRDVGAATMDENGRPCRMSGAATDVTDLKAAEAALVAAKERLEEAQAIAGLGSWERDLVAGTQTRSAEVFRILEADAGAIGDAPADFFAHVHPEDRSRVADAWAESMASGLSRELEHRIVTPAGRVKWVRARWKAELDAEGRPVRAAGTIQDVTEHMLAREAQSLARAKEAAEEANRAKSAFLASMSHEIRTPMNAILGFCQLLLGDASLTLRQREQLGAIHRSGEHLLGLIDDVLEMSKIEAGRVAVSPSDVDLHGLVWDLESMFRLRAREKGLSLEVEHAGDLPRHVVTDEKKLRQILINLLGNAVKFTSRGGLRLDVRTEPGEGTGLLLRVDVSDTGPGISAEELPRLFQRFEQTRSGIDSKTGTGLGLAISRGFARLMDGDITVTSRAGEGSVFHLTLPVARSAKPAPRDTAPAWRVAGLPAGEKRRRVLVADDVPENREVLRQMLGRVGFDVRTANDGASALDLAAEWPPDLVLMDLKMPGMDGLEATRRLRARESGHRVPIVAVTASAFEEDRRKVREAGGDDFVTKPFREADLLRTVGRCMGISFVVGGGENESAGPTAERGGARETIPGELRAALRSAAVSADLERVLKLAEELEAECPVTARTVRELAERFENERLLALLDEEG